VAVNSGKTKAVLIFAASIIEDLERRKLHKRFSPLVQLPPFDASVIRKADVHVFTTESGYNCRNFASLHEVSIHLQKGQSFGERLTNAIEELANLGYSEIVMVGRDCPDLEIADIHLAFDRLGDFRLVLGPDHRGGCYLIAIHAADRSELCSVIWQQDTDRIQLQEIFLGETFILPVKHDIDSVADIRLLARTNSKSSFEARLLLQELQASKPQEQPHSYIYLPVDRQRSFWQLPPPLAN